MSSDSRLKVLPVACAVIRQDQRYLCVQRSEIMREPLLWEFPGGKVEAGEDVFACLHREIAEELGVAIDIRGALRAHAVDQGSRLLVLMPLLAVITNGALDLREHCAAEWLTLEELGSKTFCPADLDIPLVLQNSMLEQSRWWL